LWFEFERKVREIRWLKGELIFSGGRMPWLMDSDIRTSGSGSGYGPDVRRMLEGKVLSIQNFKLSFLGLLYSWNHMVSGSFNFSFLDFIDKIMYESLRA